MVAFTDWSVFISLIYEKIFSENNYEVRSKIYRTAHGDVTGNEEENTSPSKELKDLVIVAIDL